MDFASHPVRVEELLKKEAIVMQLLSSLERDTPNRDQTLKEAICISHNDSTRGKDMNSIIIPPALGK